MRKIILFAIVLVLILLLVSQYRNGTLLKKSPLALNSKIQTNTTNIKPERISIVAQNLEIPWALDSLIDGRLIVTERNGNVRLVDVESKKVSNPILQIPVNNRGEGGLLGTAVHNPNYLEPIKIFFYYTYEVSGNNTLNRVVRYDYDGKKLIEEKIIVDRIPGSSNHNGGRIKFGPDGFLYITTGDAQEPSLAQNKNSLAGKILRVDIDGNPAPGNPFNTRVYSYGHRNPQGLAWDSSGRLWETEHGNNATDEINIIIKGANYGWPTITGDQKKSGMQSPFAQSGLETWAPAGAVFYNNSLFFGGLKGQALFELKVENGNAIITKHFFGEFGRIRDVIVGPYNLLYITTSNHDGRGNPVGTDDRILKIDPSQL